MHLKSVKHVVCYLSGDVNSAVAALLAKGKGNFITGLFLRNKFEDHDIVERQREQAHKVGEILKIPVKDIILNDADWETFTRPVLTEYKQGNSPSLDVLYARHIIFGGLLDKAVNEIGAEYVVSGYYARTTTGDKFDKWTRYLGNKLLKAIDQLEDQSYQLSLVPQACLQKTYFPLGDFNRSVVSRIVNASELKNLYKQNNSENQTYRSMEEKLLKYFEKEIPDLSGKIVDLESGDVLGKHSGLHLWHTGMPMKIGETVHYVAEKNMDKKCIQVVQDNNHPSLHTDTFFTSLIQWSHETPYDFFQKHMMNGELRFQCYHPLRKCTLTLSSCDSYQRYNHIMISSCKSFRNIIPGRIIAFYLGEECIGGAKVLHTGPSKYNKNYTKFGKFKNPSTLKNSTDQSYPKWT